MTRGEYITNLRKKRGLTQEQVAQELSISRSAVSKFENDTNEMDIQMIEAFANFYNENILNIIYANPNAYKDVTNDVLNIHLEKYNMQLENIKKDKELLQIKNKMMKVKLLSIILSILIVLLFFIYYFYNTYNSIHAYFLNSTNDKILFESGFILKTNDKIILNINNINIDDSSIKKIELYYLNDNDKIVLYSISGNNVKNNNTITTIKSLKENETFFNNFHKIKNNLYLRIILTDTIVINSKLELQKIYNNNSLLFIKNNNTTNYKNDSNNIINIDNIKYIFIEINSNEVWFFNDDLGYNYTIFKNENILFYDDNDIYFEYDTKNKKFISGDHNKEKVDLFYKLYDLYKEKNNSN